MGALPTPDFAENRYFYYVNELRQFFVASGLTCGSPADILAFNNQLRNSAIFFDHLSSHIRSILFREGGSMPRAQLLEIFAVAIGGSEMEQPAQHFREPMRELFAFVTGTMQRPGSPPLRTRGQVVTFPSETPGEPASEHVADPPPSLTLESPSDSATDPDLLPLSSASSSTSRTSPRPLSLRSLLVVGATVVLIAILLVLALRPHPSAPANSHAIPAYSPPATARHAKPSPYGEALSHAPRRHTHAHAQTPGVIAASTAAPETAPDSTEPAASTVQPANQ